MMIAKRDSAVMVLDESLTVPSLAVEPGLAVPNAENGGQR